MHIKKFGAAEIGEMLLLRREPDNIKDKSAVAVMKETDIVGHVPYNISSKLTHFLRRECNKSFVQVTGNCVNRGLVMAWKFPALIYYVDLRDSQKNPGIPAIFGRRWTYLARFHSMIHCMHATVLLCGVWLKKGPRPHCPSLGIDFVRLVQVLLSVVRSLEMSAIQVL